MKKLNIREVQVDFAGLDWETGDNIIQITKDNGENVRFTGFSTTCEYFRYSNGYNDFDCYTKSDKHTLITAEEFIEMFEIKEESLNNEPKEEIVRKFKVGDKVQMVSLNHTLKTCGNHSVKMMSISDIGTVNIMFNKGNSEFIIIDDVCYNQNDFILYQEEDNNEAQNTKEIFNPQKHYENKHGSAFKIAEKLGLNSWEFDIFKRLLRCRKKGQFEEDMQKIKDTVDIYLKEYEG